MLLSILVILFIAIPLIKWLLALLAKSGRKLW